VSGVVGTRCNGTRSLAVAPQNRGKRSLWSGGKAARLGRGSVFLITAPFGRGSEDGMRSVFLITAPFGRGSFMDSEMRFE